MALLLRKLYDQYHYLFHEYEDPRLADYPLASSTIPVLAIMVIYLLFVFNWGPALMKNRKPYNLTTVVRIYNLCQIITNLLVATYTLYYSYLQSDFSLTCQLHDPTNTKPYMRNLVFANYLSFIGKFLDMLDTIFFVLRKKNSQITFLHVYHHGGIPLLFHFIVKFAAGSHLTFLTIINNYVHVVMYGYYLLTSFEANATKYAWCKKYITQLQLIQFGSIFIHFAILLLQTDCNHPLFITMCMLVQDTFMILLFSDFYVRTYVTKKTN